MEIKNYPDGTSYAVVDPTQEFTFRINSYGDLWHLNQIVDAQNNLGITPTITIPNLIDAQADRRFNKNESHGLKLVCKFLNQMNAKFRIFHPHNQEVVEALLDNAEIIDNSEFVNKVLNRLSPINNLILLSTDGGSYKWINKIADKIGFTNEVYGASKMRKYEDNKSKIVQVIDRQDFEGKDVLVIDDISIFGGTFKGLSKMLKERNCGKLYLAISHMTVQELGQDPVTDYFDKVFTTNSKFDEYFIEDYKGASISPKNLEIIKSF